VTFQSDQGASFNSCNGPILIFDFPMPDASLSNKSFLLVHKSQETHTTSLEITVPYPTPPAICKMVPWIYHWQQCHQTVTSTEVHPQGIYK